MPGRLPGFGGSLHEALYVPSGPAEPIDRSLRPGGGAWQYPTYGEAMTFSTLSSEPGRQLTTLETATRRLSGHEVPDAPGSGPAGDSRRGDHLLEVARLDLHEAPHHTRYLASDRAPSVTHRIALHSEGDRSNRVIRVLQAAPGVEIGRLPTGPDADGPPGSVEGWDVLAVDTVDVASRPLVEEACALGLPIVVGADLPVRFTPARDATIVSGAASGAGLAAALAISMLPPSAEPLKARLAWTVAGGAPPAGGPAQGSRGGAGGGPAAPGRSGGDLSRAGRIPVGRLGGEPPSLAGCGLLPGPHRLAMEGGPGRPRVPWRRGRRVPGPRCLGRGEIPRCGVLRIGHSGRRAGRLPAGRRRAR